MASHAEQNFASTGLWAVISSAMAGVFTAIAKRMMAYGEARAHFHEIQALERMSDAQLADIGLKRDDIVRHALRGQFYL